MYEIDICIAIHRSDSLHVASLPGHCRMPMSYSDGEGGCGSSTRAVDICTPCFRRKKKRVSFVAHRIYYIVLDFRVRREFP